MKFFIQTILITLLILMPSESFAEGNIEDFFGNKVKLPNKISRIISLSPATTEIVYYLGLEKSLVAVTLDCNYPVQAKSKPKVGKFGFIDFEKIIMFKPDLILATKDMNKQLDQLKSYSVPVIGLQTESLEDVFSNINLIGKITNTQKIATQKTKELRNRLAIVNTKTNKSLHKPTIFYCIWHDPLMTAGNKSFVGDLIKLAGGKNVGDKIKAPYAQFSIESLLRANPEFLIIPETNYTKIDFTKIPWQKLKAVKNKKVVQVKEDIYLRPGPRILDALEELQRIIQKP